ncbi:MAG: phosphonate-binding protein, partial [Phenylobacterium sp.]|nr:phosphonate-binding protein [Phenylobacterium sp.]
LAVPVEQLETLDEILRGAPSAGGGLVLPDSAREALGWSADQARSILKGLGFAPIRRPGEPVAWRRRGQREFAVEHRAPPPHSPFAALAALRNAPPPARRRRRRTVAK